MLDMIVILVSALRMFVFFFFKQKTAYEMRISDWSSDVCSSDLLRHLVHVGHRAVDLLHARRLRFGGCRNLACEGGDLADLADDAVEGIAGLVDELDAGFDLLGAGGDEFLDVPGGVGRSLGERAHLVGDDGEALARSEERRCGKGGVRTCRSRWWPYH